MTQELDIALQGPVQKVGTRIGEVVQGITGSMPATAGIMPQIFAAAVSGTELGSRDKLLSWQAVVSVGATVLLLDEISEASDNAASLNDGYRMGLVKLVDGLTTIGIYNEVFLRIYTLFESRIGQVWDAMLIEERLKPGMSDAGILMRLLDQYEFPGVEVERMASFPQTQKYLAIVNASQAFDMCCEGLALQVNEAQYAGVFWDVVSDVNVLTRILTDYRSIGDDLAEGRGNVLIVLAREMMSQEAGLQFDMALKRAIGLVNEVVNQLTDSIEQRIEERGLARFHTVSFARGVMRVFRGYCELT
ncbi:hypothetical protein JW766_04175 [Candidatus Dojkabacteria bacterium]|nr:hypothetical protein [Candidatus Dojkabacteria bacterium]